MQKKEKKMNYKKPELTDLDSFLNKADGVYCTKLAIHPTQAVHLAQISHAAQIICPTL